MLRVSPTSPHRPTALTPCIIEMFEASSKEDDTLSLVLTQILFVRLCSSVPFSSEAICQALHNRNCAINPAPSSFQVPWPLSVRGLGLGSLSEEHVRAITAHKYVPLPSNSYMS